MAFSQSLFVSSGIPAYRRKLNSLAMSERLAHSLSCFPVRLNTTIVRANEHRKMEIIAEPGSTLTLLFVAPKLDEQGTVDSPSETTPTYGTESIKTFLIMRYMLLVVYFLERCFGKDFLVSILTDGVSNPINEIRIFGFLEHAKPYMAKYPRTAYWMVSLIPVWDLALKAALLYWVQSVYRKATAENGTVEAVAVNGKASTTSGKADVTGKEHEG